MPTLALPRRVVLGREAVEELARRTGTSVPWPAGPAPADPTPGPGQELTRHGLLDEDGVLPEVVFAMELLHAPAVLIEVDVAVRRGSSHAQLRSWQRWRDGRVASVSTAGGAVELGWWADDLWQPELARTVDVTVPRHPVEPPADDLRLPHDVLLGAGEALRQDRSDVVAELASRTDCGADQVWRLHTAALGRMRTVVAGAGRSGDRKAGVVSWMLYADGWRALTPYVGSGAAEGVPMVRVHRVPPAQLGVEVAGLVTRVRS